MRCSSFCPYSARCFVSLTFTFEPLPDEAPQHLPTIVAEGGGLVGVDIEGVGSDLEVFDCGLSWKQRTSGEKWNACSHKNQKNHRKEQKKEAKRRERETVLYWFCMSMGACTGKDLPPQRDLTCRCYIYTGAAGGATSVKKFGAWKSNPKDTREKQNDSATSVLLFFVVVIRDVNLKSHSGHSPSWSSPISPSCLWHFETRWAHGWKQQLVHHNCE